MQASWQRDNLRAPPAGQDQEADTLVFLLSQPPFPSIQCMTFSCPDLDSCQNFSVF